MSRGNPGYTKKPCAVCGTVPDWKRRGAVCEECLSLVEDGKKLRAQMGKKKGESSFQMCGNSYHMHYYEGDLDSDVRTQLSVAVYELVLASSHATIVHDSIADDKVPVPSETVFSHPKIEHGRIFVKLPRHVQAAFDALDQSIRLAIDNAYEKGKGDGGDLLKNLIKGEITNEEMNRRMTNNRG